MKVLFVAFSFLVILSTAQAKSRPNEDYDRQNENIGLDTSPTATRVRNVEMVLGAIHSIEEQVSMGTGSEELANRNSNADETGKTGQPQKSSN